MTRTVQLNNVIKDYPTRTGKRRILDNISFTLEKGEKLGVLGCNGAGKSTLIRIISGAEHATSGTIERTMSVSWPLAFQGGFVGGLTGIDNLRFICRVYDVPYASALKRVEDFSELGSYLREPVSRYSAGMRARLAFAISMAVDFDCYLIDEISAVGDRRFNEKCKNEIFSKKSNRSIVMVSHFMGVVKEYCDFFCVLDGGHLTRFESKTEAESYYNNVVLKKKISF